MIIWKLGMAAQTDIQSANATSQGSSCYEEVKHAIGKIG